MCICVCVCLLFFKHSTLIRKLSVTALFKYFRFFFSNPEELYTEFDPTGVVFKPAVPIPKRTSTMKTITNHHFINSELNEYINTINNTELFANGYIDFYKAYNG